MYIASLAAPFLIRAFWVTSIHTAVIATDKGYNEWFIGNMVMLTALKPGDWKGSEMAFIRSPHMVNSLS